jgi:glycosyltransferase involved in cell wall biosynthesis
MKDEGWRLVFVGWSTDASHLTEEHQAAMSSIFDDWIFFQNSKSWLGIIKRLVLLARHSPHMSSRFVERGARTDLCRQLERHTPDAVVMDGLYGADLGRQLADHLKLPLVYRSHNIEHLYMPKQARAAKSYLRKFAMHLASLHLKRAETDIVKRADWVFDISAEDMLFWQTHANVEHISWLPPLLNFSPSSPRQSLPWKERPYDAVYLGNLNTPNNVEGLSWFIENVLPGLRSKRPAMSILIAGSNPAQAVIDMIEHDPCLQLRANPPDVTEVRALGRVMINPILQGSGVNVKSVEMLSTDSPIVTTSIGVQGLDADTAKAFLVADTPSEFANMIDFALDHGPAAEGNREEFRKRFGQRAAQTLSCKLSEIIGQKRA